MALVVTSLLLTMEEAGIGAGQPADGTPARL